MEIRNLNSLTQQEIRALLDRNVDPDSSLTQTVENICMDVKRRGDEAVLSFTKDFDAINLDGFLVQKEEIDAAFESIGKSLSDSMIKARDNILKFHEAQKSQIREVITDVGISCSREARAIDSVGLYVPGGTAPLVSTVLMLGVPAQLAGCERIAMTTPPNADGNISPSLLAAAKLVGIQDIYKIGGAQAIAALAYGTESIQKVDKIFGPGNQYVNAAKMFVSIDPDGAAIDLPAGPTELLIIADDKAIPLYVALDLAAQAEHGINSNVLLLTDSEEFANFVSEAISNLSLPDDRQEIINSCLNKSLILTVENIEEAIRFSNEYAPEHISLQIENSELYKDAIRNAGTVFLGGMTPAAAGDYATGANHTLPTNGNAKSYSGLSLVDFQKFITFQKTDSLGLENIASAVEGLAKSEGLYLHYESVQARLNDV